MPEPFDRPEVGQFEMNQCEVRPCPPVYHVVHPLDAGRIARAQSVQARNESDATTRCEPHRLLRKQAILFEGLVIEAEADPA